MLCLRSRIEVKTAAGNIIKPFLFLPGLAPVLFLISFCLQQQSVRHQMKERMELQHLHTITLANDDIHWIKEGKEIWVNGKMFDIKLIEPLNGMTRFSGLFDEEETLLATQLKKGWDKRSAPDNRLLLQFFKCFQHLCCQPPGDPGLIVPMTSQYLAFSPIQLPDWTCSIPSPPPQA